MVDVDGGQLLHSYGDEQRIIPRKLQKALVSSIKDDAGTIVVVAVVVVLLVVVVVVIFVVTVSILCWWRR